MQTSSRAPSGTRFRWRLEAAAFDLAAGLAARLSPSARLTAGTALGTVFWALDARHRRRARVGVGLAFGSDLTPREANRLVRASMRHFARLSFESLAMPAYLPSGTPDAPVRHVSVEGFDHMRDALAQGRGAVGFSGHIGNWELLTHTLGRAGMPSALVARPLDNPLIEARIARVRSQSGNRVLGKRGAVQEALSVLRDGRIVGILIDHHPRTGGIPVPFFGRQVMVRDTLARLALRTGAPIVPGFAALDPGGTWHVTVEPEVPVARTGDVRSDCVRIMSQCTAILEGWIRRYPEQWLWTHARWRDR